MDHYGSLDPIGGGEPIPLLRAALTLGRRESCDIVLRFANVSGQHCKLTLENGYWFVQDLNSQNGIRVNGTHVIRKRLDPNDTLSIAKHKYKINYSPEDLGATGPPPSDEEDITTVLGKSLLERAGLRGAAWRWRRIIEPPVQSRNRRRGGVQEERAGIGVRIGVGRLRVGGTADSCGRGLGSNACSATWSISRSRTTRPTKSWRCRCLPQVSDGPSGHDILRGGHARA